MSTEHVIIPVDHLTKNVDAILDPLEYDIENQSFNPKMKEVEIISKSQQKFKYIKNMIYFKIKNLATSTLPISRV
jgi:hypothetical protein